MGNKHGPELLTMHMQIYRLY